MTEIPGALGLGPDQVSSLLEAARRAPSLHNAQPWRFRLTPNTIELHADLTRRLPAADPDDTELRIGCGAALLNLRIALLGEGIRPTVTVLPDPQQPALIATIRNGGHKAPTPEIRRLLHAIPLRRTNRHPFSDTHVALKEQYALRRAALDEGAWLHLMAGPEHQATLRGLAAEAHQAQIADPAFVAELARWTGDGTERADGVPAAAGGPRPDAPASWVVRDFSAGRATDGAPSQEFEEDPLIAVLTSHLSGHAAEVQAGQALQRVLLTATANGLAASFLSHLVEVPASRERLRRLINGTRPPQVVLRIGYGWPVAPTPRRPVAELLMPDPARFAGQ